MTSLIKLILMDAMR